MRAFVRIVCVALFVLAGWAAPARLAQAANQDTTADRVFGQPDFTHNSPNNGGVSASSLGAPAAVALDAQGYLYVADTSNNRLLEYAAPLTTDQSANRVFGQLDFMSNSPNIGASGLDHPRGVDLDDLGNLFVADAGNNRVLEYNTPLSSDTIADRVFGQPDFVSNIANNGGLGRASLSFPTSVALDAQGNLFVADTNNNRVLEHDRPLPLLGLFLPLMMR